MTVRRSVRLSAPPVGVGCLVIAAWSAIAALPGVPASTLPGPAAVVGALSAESDVLAGAAAVTAREIVLGLMCATVAGVVLATAMAWFPLVRRALYPWIVVSQLIPVVALAPVVVLWTGFDLRPKVIVVTLVAFFPLVVTTLDGLRGTDPELVRVMRTLGARDRDLLRTAIWPSAMPAFFSGLKVAGALAVVGAVFAEWVGSSDGLGYLILVYNNQLATAEMFAAITVLCALGLVVYGLLVWLERLLVPWSSRS